MRGPSYNRQGGLVRDLQGEAGSQNVVEVVRVRSNARLWRQPCKEHLVRCEGLKAQAGRIVNPSVQQSIETLLQALAASVRSQSFEGNSQNSRNVEAQG
eukprot:4176947-Amphidinium_carterae.1